MKFFKYHINNVNIKLRDFEEVMLPSQYSLLLASGLNKNNYSSALDLGCGSGFLSIILAKLGLKEVFAVDINKECIKATIYNASLNGVDSRIYAFHGDLYNPVLGKKFDLIVSNPPTFPKSDSLPTYCYGGGEDGRHFLNMMISRAHNYLNLNGSIQFVISSLFNPKLILRMLVEKGFQYKVQKSVLAEFRPYYMPLITYFQRDREAKYFKYDSQLYEKIFLIHARLIVGF